MKKKEQTKKAADLAGKTEEKPKKQRSDIKGTGQGWRKGKYKYSADELEVKAQEYFQAEEDQGHRATWPGFAGYLGIPADTLTEWIRNKDNNTDVWCVLKKVSDKMSHLLQQEDKAMPLFLLKQPCYGGYADRQDNLGDGQISVNVVFGNSNGKGTESFGK